MRRAWIVFGVVLLAGGAARAQSSPPADQAEQVRMLLERVQQLERRVTELEARQTPPQAGAISAANEPSPQLRAQQAAQAAANPAPGRHRTSTMCRSSRPLPFSRWRHTIRRCRFGDLVTSIFRRRTRRGKRAALILGSSICTWRRRCHAT